MGRLRRPGGRAIAVAAVSAAALAVVAVVALAAQVRPAGSEPAQLLRLGDLPLGFVNLELREEHGEAPLCERLTDPEDTPPRMLSFVRRFRPRGCVAGYGFLFAENAGPSFVGSGVLEARSKAEADAAWAVAPEILSRAVGDRPLSPAPPVARIGARTRAFHTRIELVDGASPVTFLLWRSGNTLATVMALGGRFAATDRAAAEYARQQQAHIAKPSPYTEAELYDGEVGLDDPAIPFPVQWLGRNFTPGGGLPVSQLRESYYRGRPRSESSDGIVEGPSAPLIANYTGIGLDTWTQRTWPVFARSKTGRAITSWKCTKTRTLTLAEGTATIFGGYKKDFAHCPRSAPEAFTAWVKIGRETVVVNAPFAADSIEVANPYGTFAGMEAIIRGLKLRPRRAG